MGLFGSLPPEAGGMDLFTRCQRGDVEERRELPVGVTSIGGEGRGEMTPRDAPPARRRADSGIVLEIVSAQLFREA